MNAAIGPFPVPSRVCGTPSRVTSPFTVSGLQVEGNAAEAKLNGTYDFVTSSGRSEHQPLTLQVALRKDGATWRFLSIR